MHKLWVDEQRRNSKKRTGEMLFKWQKLDTLFVLETILEKKKKKNGLLLEKRRRFFIKIRGVSESVTSVSALRPKMFYFKSGAFRIKIEVLYDFSVACAATTFDA